ncbi:alpha-L-fucosidase [Paraflavitalea speifideaquila]|uniref:alpha-L-fucosidase n=1 Tax=Paraflavitalea speifideaquila TaxID=3076558 RepID=UPI0028EF80C9|nr:alpha-L-fucosidase [Paraflavitalea speifideiaquila]
MKAQLTELLTNYGEVAGIWFDGHWDQLENDHNKTAVSKVDWKYDEIYSLIHRLQPQCMISNNHHLTPIPGEDFQAFEKTCPVATLQDLAEPRYQRCHWRPAKPSTTPGVLISLTAITNPIKPWYITW